MSPITTLFGAACAAVAVSDANNSHGIVRSAIEFFILHVSLIFGSFGGGKLKSGKAGSNWPFVAILAVARKMVYGHATAFRKE
jgi:hypothetical protein